MLVLFWTDILLFSLVVLVVGFAIYASRKEHLRAPWREVSRSGVAMSALVVLSLYLVIGLLDSVHFRPQLADREDADDVRYSTEVLSAFDWLFADLRKRSEKTYSAPFAIHLYNKEVVESELGERRQVYPRLKFGGAHLPNAQKKTIDIALTSVVAGLKALALWALIVLAIARLWAYRESVGTRQGLQKILLGHTVVSWRAILFSLFFVLLITWVAIDLSQKYHVLGTDKVGEDVFYQALKSIRTGLVIGTLTTLVMLPFAILFGIMAGYFGGWVDDFIQYFYTTLNSIPSVLLIAAAILMLQVYLDNHATEFSSVSERADLRLLFLCLILGVTSWTGLCRYLRGESLKLREIDFIQSATALGVGHFSIIVRHILPNVMHIVLITVVLDFSGLVLAEAVLSYVQIGVDPTTNSWGNMINSARLEMARDPIVWWSLAAAFIFMFTLVLAANLFSDAVRDAFDPRLRTRS
ncbi:MAG: ABC transporter permease [Arenicellales bacterium]|nr:ABC transporter permease [Arenicellales bacterium]